MVAYPYCYHAVSIGLGGVQRRIHNTPGNSRDELCLHLCVRGVNIVLRSHTLLRKRTLAIHRQSPLIHPAGRGTNRATQPDASPYSPPTSPPALPPFPPSPLPSPPPTPGLDYTLGPHKLSFSSVWLQNFGAGRRYLLFNMLT